MIPTDMLFDFQEATTIITPIIHILFIMATFPNSFIFFQNEKQGNELVHERSWFVLGRPAEREVRLEDGMYCSQHKHGLHSTISCIHILFNRKIIHVVSGTPSYTTILLQCLLFYSSFIKYIFRGCFA